MRPIGGFLADRFGGWRILAVVFVMASLALAAVGLHPPLAAGSALLFAVMGFLGVGNGAVFQLVPQRFGRQIGVATGMIGSAGGLAGFLLPTMLGMVKEATGSYETGFFCLSLAGAYAVSLVTHLRGSSPVPRAPAGSTAKLPESAPAEEGARG
jgi:NNP family nitrate/nitrite transporter-like MFS transporter